MRRVWMLALLGAVAIAGCGGSRTSPDASAPPARQPRAESHVFTVPAKLPPRERAPATATAKRPARAAPADGSATPVASGGQVAAGAAGDAEVQAELAQALGVKGSHDVVDQAGLTAAGLATVPPSAPAKVAAIITAANQVARAPYRYGGGHGGVGGKETWVDSAYDCSGSVSFALASAGLVHRQLDSTSFESWGKPGRGRWVTVYANPEHAFMVVAGLRFDTVERSRTGTRWGLPPSSVSGFVVRHPAGL